MHIGVVDVADALVAERSTSNFSHCSGTGFPIEGAPAVGAPNGRADDTCAIGPVRFCDEGEKAVESHLAMLYSDKLAEFASQSHTLASARWRSMQNDPMWSNGEYPGNFGTGSEICARCPSLLWMACAADGA